MNRGNMLDEIKRAHAIVSQYLGNGLTFNTPVERAKVKEMLQGLLFWQIHRVTCDETNNTPEVIDNNQMIARLEWKGVDGLIRYIDLVFGDVEIAWEDEVRTMPDIDPQTGETNPYYVSWKEEVEKVKEVEKAPSNKVFLIDIDGTVGDDIKNEDSHLYATANHFPDALEIINKWYDEGNVITFFTARESKDREVTETWLNEKGFKYHGLVMDKPRIKDGQEYVWIDNRKVRAVTYLGTWGELKEVDAKIQTFG